MILSGTNKKKLFFGILLILISFLFLDFLDQKSFASLSDDDQIRLFVNIQGALILDCDESVNFGLVKYGAPASTLHQCRVTTDSPTGYSLEVKRNDGQTTLDKDTNSNVNIADKYDWNPTSNGGWGNAEPYENTGLAFSIYASTATKNDIWWGTGNSCHDSNNLYAGFPYDFELIMTHPNYSAVPTTTSICGRLGIPANQEAGLYNGVITYQAMANP